MGNVVNLASDNENSKDRLNTFAIAYANNGGDHVQAYIDAGFSAKTAGQNAKKYLDKHFTEVMAVMKKEMGLRSAKASFILDMCINDEAAPWSAKLKAVEMMLKNSGVQKDTLVIEEDKAEDMTPEERQQEINALLSKVKGYGN